MKKWWVKVRWNVSNSSHERLEAALEAVLIFYTVGDWNKTDSEGRTPSNRWQCAIAKATENRIRPTEATTKVLCDAIRDVLEYKPLAQHRAQIFEGGKWRNV